MDMRDFMAGELKGEYKLFPYAKDLHYHKEQNMLTMTVEMYNDINTQEFSFGFKCSDQLKRFLDRTIGDNDEE